MNEAFRRVYAIKLESRFSEIIRILCDNMLCFFREPAQIIETRDCVMANMAAYSSVRIRRGDDCFSK